MTDKTEKPFDLDEAKKATERILNNKLTFASPYILNISFWLRKTIKEIERLQKIKPPPTCGSCHKWAKNMYPHIYTQSYIEAKNINENSYLECGATGNHRTGNDTCSRHPDWPEWVKQFGGEE